MDKQGMYSEDLAGKLIRQAHADLDALYVPGFAQWARVNHPDLVSAVVSAFNAIDVPCDKSDLQGLHAALASTRSAAADLAIIWRRHQSGGGVVAAPPAPPSTEEISPMVHMIPGEESGAQKLLFGGDTMSGPLTGIGV